jgi:hypothetical protein
LNHSLNIIIIFVFSLGVSDVAGGNGGGEDQHTPRKNKKNGTKLLAGLYKHVSGYLVLGAVSTEDLESQEKQKQTNRPPAGAAPTQVVDPLPVLTKVLLKRSDVLSLEDSLRALQVDLSVALSLGSVMIGIGGNVVLKCAERLGEIAILLVMMLTDGSKNVTSAVIGADSSIPSLLIKMTHAKNVNLKNEGEIGEEKEEKDSMVSPGWSCSLPFSDAFITNFADVFSCDKDIDTLLDNNLCIFLRTILGYQMPPPLPN